MVTGGFARAGLIRRAAALLAAVWLALAGWLPAAAAAPLAAACHAYAASPAQAAALVRAGPGWACANRAWQDSPRYALVRFDLGPGGTVPAQFSTRLARFESARIHIERRDGRIDTFALPVQAFRPTGNMRIVADLPTAGSPARRLTAEFATPTVNALLADARLHPAALPRIGIEQLWIAALCGLLLVPLFFNLALYRALGDRFVLWHTGVVGFMLGHTLASSGFLALAVDIPVPALSLVVALCFCGGAACALMLASDFIEPDALDPRSRQMLRLAAVWLLLNGAFYAVTIDWLQGHGLTAYLLNWAGVIAVLVYAGGRAVRRGSRAARWLVASWLPLIATGVWQIAESLQGDHAEPMLVFVVQRFAIGAEVLIASIGIADRFIQLRRDRDDHRVLARQMSRLAERDPLTGLRNRRAIESRFAALRADGFATLALLDLDHFKAVNDRFGHAVGDDVLRAVAASLPDDANALAVRMGGEEFLLLLRGGDAVQRAEQVRRGLTARVAHAVPGLDRPLCASMGLVEIPAEVVPDASFGSIYARADGLLYQAKRAGRNRTMHERMTAFARPPLRRRLGSL